MTNTEMLENKIRESGKKIGYLAAKCGLSYGTFRNCVLNKSEFRVSHIKVLCDELNIDTLREREAIFFAKVGE